MTAEQIRALRIISIDPSLRSTGVYCFDKGHGRSFCIKTRGKDRAECLLGIHEGLNNHLSAITYNLAIVEDYAYGIRQTKSLTALGEVRGVVLMTIRAWAVPAIDLNIAMWKHLTIGMGHKKATKADRESYLSTVEQLFGRIFATTDEADAYMMFRAVGKILMGKARTVKARELCAQIEKAVSE